MAFGDAKKRKLASGATGLQTKKQKTGKQTPKIKSKKSNPKRPAAVDSLQWRSAKLPDMFDDAGGFYGLEEVDDVEIVRNGNVVEFVSAIASPRPAITQLTFRRELRKHPPPPQKATVPT